MATANDLVKASTDPGPDDGPPPVPRTVFGQLEKMEETIARLLPAHIDPEAWVSSIYNGIKYNGDLMEIARHPVWSDSLWGAVMTCAQLGLTPGKATQEAWIIPREDKYFRWVNDKGVTVKGAKLAVYQLGYRGLIELLDRTGRYSGIQGGHAYPDEIVTESTGIKDGRLNVNFEISPIRPRPVHARYVPALEDFDDPASGHRRDVTFYLCWELDGKAMYHAMGAEEIYDHYLATHPHSEWGKNKAGRKITAWDKHYPTMALVSVARVGFRFLPKSTQLAAALAQDNAVRMDIRPEALDEAPDAQDDDDTDEAADDVTDAELVADTGGVNVPDTAAEPDPVQVVESVVDDPDEDPVQALANQFNKTTLVQYLSADYGEDTSLDRLNRYELLTLAADRIGEPAETVAAHIHEWARPNG